MKTERNEMETTTTAWNLAGYWPADLVGFRIGRSPVIWESATATWNRRGADRVRIQRFDTEADYLKVNTRYLDPDTPVIPIYER